MTFSWVRPDSIPAIDDPKFLPAECVDFLLDQVQHVDTFWFAWAAYSPDTRIEP